MTLPRSDQTRIAFVLTPHFNMAGTMGFLDPFRAANYLAGESLFRWDFLSETGGTCRASNGLAVEVAPLSDLQTTAPDMVIFSSSWTPEAFTSPAMLSVIRRHARKGCYLGAIDTGAFLLARAGLLSGRTATVHYEHIDAFTETYPDIQVSEDIFVSDGQIGTCCGGLAATDYALFLLRRMAGEALANDCAKYIFAQTVRGPGTHQTDPYIEPLGSTAPLPVRRAIEVMEQNLETPLSIPDICSVIRMSQRQLDRLFHTHVGLSPQLYYRNIRLDRARGLVTQTDMRISEVAFAAGFTSQEHFSRAYKSRFGLPPSRDRVEGRVPFEFRAWPMHRRGFRGENGGNGHLSDEQG